MARIRNSDVDDALLQSRVSVIFSYKKCDKVVVRLYMMIVANRVRVAVRLRPRNTEELHADMDFADCVELQPEVCLYPSRVSSILSCSSKYPHPWYLCILNLERVNHLLALMF